MAEKYGVTPDGNMYGETAEGVQYSVDPAQAQSATSSGGGAAQQTSSSRDVSSLETAEGGEEGKTGSTGSSEVGDAPVSSSDTTPAPTQSTTEGSYSEQDGGTGTTQAGESTTDLGLQMPSANEVGQVIGGVMVAATDGEIPEGTSQVAGDVMGAAADDVAGLAGQASDAVGRASDSVGDVVDSIDQAIMAPASDDATSQDQQKVDDSGTPTGDGGMTGATGYSEYVPDDNVSSTDTTASSSSGGSGSSGEQSTSGGSSEEGSGGSTPTSGGGDGDGDGGMANDDAKTGPGRATVAEANAAASLKQRGSSSGISVVQPGGAGPSSPSSGGVDPGDNRRSEDGDWDGATTSSKQSAGSPAGSKNIKQKTGGNNPNANYEKPNPESPSSGNPHSSVGVSSKQLQE